MRAFSHQSASASSPSTPTPCSHRSRHASPAIFHGLPPPHQHAPRYQARHADEANTCASASRRMHVVAKVAVGRRFPTPATSPTAKHKQNGAVRPIDDQVLKDCSTAFSSLLREYAYWVDEAWIDGAIPKDLLGTYFRNGPGMQVDSERCRRHAFDGDGMVFSLAFKDGKAFFRNRFVRTKGFVEEQAAGKPLFRTTFSSGAADGSPLFNPLDLSFKNVANTGIMHWAGKLYALWEAGKPHELDPRTLETLGESDMGGLLNGPLAGHYRVCYDEATKSQRWITFGTDVTFGGLTARFYEHDAAGRCVSESRHKLPGVDITFIHDMAVTENYYVLVLGPIEFDWLRFATQYIFGRCSIAQCLRFNKHGSAKAMLFPRPDRPGAAGRRPLAFRIPRAFFPFHNVNAYEEPGTSRVVVDTVGWNDVDFDINRFITTPEYYQGGCRPEYLRVVLDTSTSETVSVRPMLQDRTVEFPMVSPVVTGRRHSHVFFTADTIGHKYLWGPAQALIQVELPREDGVEAEAAACATASRGGSAAASAAAAASAPESVRAGRGSRSGVGSSRSGSSSNRGVAVRCSAAGEPLASSGRAAPPGVQVHQWLPGPRSFCGESMIVPRPGATHELDAWVIVGVHHAETQRADIVILDAAHLADGPVATIHLPHHLPASLHGSFSQEYLGPDPLDVCTPKWGQPLDIRAL